MARHRGVKIKLHYNAVNKTVHKNPAILGELSGLAAGIAANAGPGYETRQTVSSRFGYLVYPATKEAREDNEQNNTLAKLTRQKVKAHKNGQS